MPHLARAALLAALLVGPALALGCGDNGDSGPPPTPAVTSTAGSPTGGPSGAATPTPVPTVAPASPQPGGYSGIPAVPAAAFNRMVALAQFPDDPAHAVVLTQQDGIIYRVHMTDGEAPSVFLDLGEKLINDPGNEEGLLGFAFAPDFGTSRRFFVYYTAGDPRRSIVARYEARGDTADPASERVIMEVAQPYANHNGGALVFGPDGYLYVALGDGGSGGDPQGHGQDLNDLLGSILRIDVSGDGYTVPSDNPFTSGGAPEIWAYGFRNPWRFTFDRETGDLWAGDVGQGTWEEVDRVERGGNYGWNVMEGPDCFISRDCDRTGLILPRVWYGTRQEGCAVTGGYVYRGAAMAELRGWYVYADYCSGRVWALDTRDDASPPIVLFESGASITSFAEDRDGEIYLVTFDSGILRLAR